MRPSTRIRWWISGVLLVAAIVLWTGQWLRIREQRQREGWPEAQATIQSTEIVTSLDGPARYGGSRRTRAEIQVAFDVEGVRYETTAGLEGLGSFEGLESRLPVGDEIRISYDPDDPNQAYFDIGDVSYEYTDLTPFVIVLAVASIGLVLVGRRKPPRNA